MIAALVAAGKRVGITAQSHKAITNLLDKTVRGVRGGARLAFAAVQKLRRRAWAPTRPASASVDDNGDVAPLLAAGRPDRGRARPGSGPARN